MKRRSCGGDAVEPENVRAGRSAELN